ncbi:MAG: hypothetical protein AB1896_15385 [Thermodesulfobacteriota bacterium]
MRIGVDFDNTIIQYDRVFHAAALDRGLIVPDFPASKSLIRNHLRRTGREEEWTCLQGWVYGERIREAEPFPGVVEFFTSCRESGAPVFIISHKTKRPYGGPPYDLHAAALAWLEQAGFFDIPGPGLPRTRVFLEETKTQKIERISLTGCTYFIDDLPEFLSEPGFPLGVGRLLFDPDGRFRGAAEYPRREDWRGLINFFYQEWSAHAPTRP